MTGAFVYAFVEARDGNEALSPIVEALSELGFGVLQEDGVQEYKRLSAEARRKWRLSAIARRARRTGSVALSAFFAW